MRIACGSTHIPPQSRLSPPMSRSTAIHSSSFRRMWQLIYIRRWAIIRVHTHTHMYDCEHVRQRFVCADVCARLRAGILSHAISIQQLLLLVISFFFLYFFICIALSQFECQPFSYGLHMVHLCVAAVACATAVARF